MVGQPTPTHATSTVIHGRDGPSGKDSAWGSSLLKDGVTFRVSGSTQRHWGARRGRRVLLVTWHKHRDISQLRFRPRDPELPLCVWGENGPEPAVSCPTRRAPPTMGLRPRPPRHTAQSTELPAVREHSAIGSDPDFPQVHGGNGIAGSGLRAAVTATSPRPPRGH